MTHRTLPRLTVGYTNLRMVHAVRYSIKRQRHYHPCAGPGHQYELTRTFYTSLKPVEIYHCSRCGRLEEYRESSFLLSPPAREAQRGPVEVKIHRIPVGVAP